MKFINEPEDELAFKPRQFRLTLLTQHEVDAMLILADDLGRWDPDGTVHEFLSLLGKRLRTVKRGG